MLARLILLRGVAAHASLLARVAIDCFFRMFDDQKMEKENMRNTRGHVVHFQWVPVPCLLCLSVKFEMGNVTGWVTQVKSSEAGFRKIGAKQDDELIHSKRETESMQERDRTRR